MNQPPIPEWLQPNKYVWFRNTPVANAVYKVVAARNREAPVRFAAVDNSRNAFEYSVELAEKLVRPYWLQAKDTLYPVPATKVMEVYKVALGRGGHMPDGLPYAELYDDTYELVLEVAKLRFTQTVRRTLLAADRTGKI